jgi:hypothetical protein
LQATFQATFHSHCAEFTLCRALQECACPSDIKKIANTTTESDAPSQSSDVDLQTCQGIHDESPYEIEDTASSLPEGVLS